MTPSSIHTALEVFAAAVKEKTTQIASGQPEDQLRAPFEAFLDVAGNVTLGSSVVCTGEASLSGRLGRPDYAVHVEGLLTGYVELKAPGVGADERRFTGRNLRQFRRFSTIPNILYTDGNEWVLYRNGALSRAARLSGDITRDGSGAVTPQDASVLEPLLRDFLLWEPVLPTTREGEVDLKRFAELLAPLCRMLRNDVADALTDPASPLVTLANEWRELLFPEATDAQFADAYAQTATFALLLGHSESSHPLSLQNAQTALEAQHGLLSRALEILTDPRARGEIAAPLDLLLRVISVVPQTTLRHQRDPWLYFYEDFLAAYDPQLRRDAGVYFTPVEVVHAQIRLVANLLVDRLGKQLGFAAPEVVTLDPAVGTGTYLLGVIEHALDRVETLEGRGAVPAQATELAKRLYGFELMVGSYAVADLRVTRALSDYGALLPAEGTQICLTDTLASPLAEPPQTTFFHAPIAAHHARALQVKSTVPVIVCIGNPPYDRHEAAEPTNTARTGGWVRWGDAGHSEHAILRDFVEPVTAAGQGLQVKNIYNLYVYFWRWATMEGVRT